MTAADRARQALAVEETYDLYSQALDLTSEDTDRLKIRLLRAQALVQLQDFTRAAHELAELIPLLDGETQVEALVARSHATLWTEQTEKTMACAQRVLDLARTGGFAELETAALGMVAAAHGMCGEAGDLEKAVMLGDEALANWPSHSRQGEHAEMYHLAANHCYWYGDYERGHERLRVLVHHRRGRAAQPGVQAPRRRHAGNHPGEYGSLRGGHRSRRTRDRTWAVTWAGL